MARLPDPKELEQVDASIPHYRKYFELEHEEDAFFRHIHVLKHLGMIEMRTPKTRYRRHIWIGDWSDGQRNTIPKLYVTDLRWMAETHRWKTCQSPLKLEEGMIDLLLECDALNEAKRILQAEREERGLTTWFRSGTKQRIVPERTPAHPSAECAG